MKAVYGFLSAALIMAALPVWAAGPGQAPHQAPMQQAPSKAAMAGQAPAVASSNARRTYSYEPAGTMDRRAYSYQPGGYTGGNYSYQRRYDPHAFMRTESVKSAAFKSVQQYGD